MPNLDVGGLWILVWCVGVGGAVVGLVGILLERYCGWRYVRVIAALAGVVFCVGAAALSLTEWPSTFWTPLAVLGGLSLVAWVAYSARLWRFVRRLAQPRLIWILLLIGCPLYVALAASKWTKPPEEFGWLDAVILSRDQVPGIRMLTDRGRRLKLYRFVLSPEAEQAERRWVVEEQLECHIIRTGEVDPSSNCHGWVFTGGRYAVHPDEVECILEDNGYQPVTSPSKGDLIVYRNEAGIVTHTGIVVEVVRDDLVLVESKWGPLGRFLHPPEYQPYDGDYSFYHSPRQGHQMPIIQATEEAPVPTAAVASQ